MALSQALSTGITGLMTHQKAMDNIGNNLANVNTVGFKKGVYQFSTLLEQSMRGGMGADATTGRGSVNPISMGMGAQTGSINKVFTQGDIENTGNSNDMAIDGNGFFVLKVGNGYAYTRSGSFYRGEDGSLLAGDGLFVQGTAAVKNADGSYSIPTDPKMQNIVIPIGTTGGHSQTSTVQFTGNLNSNQKISQGTQLFGGVSYPTVASLQKWMNKDFNGGNKLTDPKVDTSWNSLQSPTYAISQATMDKFGISRTDLPSSVTPYDTGIVTDQTDDTGSYAYKAIYLDDTGARRVVDLSDVVKRWNANPAFNVTPPDDEFDPSAPVRLTGAPAEVGPPPVKRVLGLNDLQDLLEAEGASATPPITAVTLVPVIEQIQTINGGNVQTSAAYGIEVPASVNNKLLLPSWFYESTGAAVGYDRIKEIYDEVESGVIPTEEDAFKEIWPNGINGDTLPQTYLPRKGEIYAASANTPLEHVRYLKGNSWVQPYANIRNGDEIDVSFKKGDSQLEITFVYNRPQGQDPFNGQVSIDREQSYTLGHFLKFLGGDLDEPTVACQNITPAMFGAPVDEDHPYGNPDSPDWSPDGRTAYEQALLDIDLAKNDRNMDDIGGAMGLLSIPPHISDKNGGTDAYDVPAESAGAYTRSGSSDVAHYQRYDPLTGQMKTGVTGNSFKTSFVSNLGSQNALTDIRISYNNIPHETMYSAETEYAAPQGGSSIMTVNFYDSLGNPKSANVRMAMVSQDNDFTTWRWYADCKDDTDFQWQADENGELSTNLNVGTGLIRFDKNGNYVKGAEYSESQGITINQANRGVNEPIWIKVLNGLSSSSKQDLDFSDMTCSATESDFKLKHQNGRPPGTLDDFTVSLDGTITGVYSNGNTVLLGRIGLAMIPNENGLIAAGSNLYYTGPASGDARYGHANTGGSGVIKHQQLESSNVDLSIEFTKLISTERGFQANSRTITTADEMIQELLNLKR